MTTHELAQQLLTMPNIEVKCPSAWHPEYERTTPGKKWRQQYMEVTRLRLYEATNDGLRSIVCIYPEDENLP